MKRILCPLLFLLFSYVSFCQAPNFQAILDSGKAAFKRQAVADTPNFSKAYQLLQKAVSIQPGSAEARYFLGCTIDKLNANDGGKMDITGKDLALQASEQFEMVNKIAPEYKGELWILDPYSKLSSIWGSLAIAYLNRHEIDSAKWAFQSGKQRGGFLEPVLEFDRQLLNSCEKNAILISSGDNYTIPMWYLQQMENFRMDVTVVDANLINAAWYVKYLKHQQNLTISYSDTEIDTINYLPWKTTDITIENPLKNTSGKHYDFKWSLKPTYYNKYILKGDRILLDIVKQNLFKRTFYFPQDSDSTCNLFLDQFFVEDGIVNRLNLPEREETKPTPLISANLQSYSIDKLSAQEIKKSPDAIWQLNGFRWGYYSNIRSLYSLLEFSKAKNLLDEMERKFDTAKLPYSSEELKANLEQLKQIITRVLALPSFETNEQQQTYTKQNSPEALRLYERIRNQVCNCIRNTMRNNKPSTTYDSCARVVLSNYKDTIKALGFDVSIHDGHNYESDFLFNQVRLYLCHDIDNLISKELADEEASKLLFKGEFVSQKKLQTGEYEIILRDSKTKVQQTFKSKRAFDESLVKGYLPDYEMKIEYEIVKNLKTNKEELYIKEYGTMSIIGMKNFLSIISYLYLIPL